MRSDKFIAKDTTIACEKAGERGGIHKAEEQYMKVYVHLYMYSVHRI